MILGIAGGRNLLHDIPEAGIHKKMNTLHSCKEI